MAVRISEFHVGRLATAAPSVASGSGRVAPDVSHEDFARNGYLSIPSLTTVEDIELIRSLLDPLFDKFDSLGDRAVDLAGPRPPGTPMRSPEINEAVILEPRLR